MSTKYFKAFIRVVQKSLNPNDETGCGFGPENIIEERMIHAEDKNEVKAFLLKTYPQFFQNGKKNPYEKSTKDEAQFFYVVIYPLYSWEIDKINEGQWECAQCGHIHDNRYISRPYIPSNIFPGKEFCNYDICLSDYKKAFYADIDLPDDEHYVKKDSPTYIYKITEKVSEKCYIGKTRNAPFFRWWNHLKHSSSPFGIYLRNTSICDWTFEVLEILPPEATDATVFNIESNYILRFDSIVNGYNTLISKSQKEVKPVSQIGLDI